MSVLKDYRKREEEFLRRAQDLEQVTGLRDAQKIAMEFLRDIDQNWGRAAGNTAILLLPLI